MSEPLEDERKFVDYLLGRLPDGERLTLEDRMLDDEMDEGLLAATDDLIHAYLAGRLSEDDRLRFEEHFLASPGHRERLAFVRDLLTAVERVAKRESRTPPVWRDWRVAAAVLLVAALALLWVGRAPAPPPQIATDPTPPIPSSTPSATTSTLPGPPSPVPVERRMVRLPPNPTAPISVRLSPGTRELLVEVDVDGESPSFDAVIRTADGKEVWRAEGLVPAAEGQPLAFSVLASALAGERYALVIEGERLRGKNPKVVAYELRIVRAP